MLTDIKHLFSCNPLNPVMIEKESAAIADRVCTDETSLNWYSFESGVQEIGHHGDEFCFDNETPRHRQFLEQFMLSSRLINNGEYLAFIESGGYNNPTLWLAEGWNWLQEHKIQHPLYWRQHHPCWQEFTLHGLTDLDPLQPVCHLSYFEASAYAAWVKARLPTEAEWEFAAQKNEQNEQITQLFDCCWQWTSSSYSPYPGYAPAVGAIGEYNGKFMSNQYVLRGSSIFTPKHHARVTYRNFFPATARWQRTGIRLAHNAHK